MIKQKVHTKKRIRHPANLGYLITLLERQTTYNSIAELAKDISEEFEVDVTEEDIVNYYAEYWEQEDLKLIYKNSVK